MSGLAGGGVTAGLHFLTNSDHKINILVSKDYYLVIIPFEVKRNIYINKHFVPMVINSINKVNPENCSRPIAWDYKPKSTTHENIISRVKTMTKLSYVCSVFASKKFSPNFSCDIQKKIE